MWVNLKNVSVDVEEKEVMDETLVSYEIEKEEIMVRESENEVNGVEEGLGVEEAVKKITDDGLGKFETVSVDVEEKEVVDGTLISYEIEKEEIGERESENKVRGVEEANGSKHGMPCDEVKKVDVFVSEDRTKEEKCLFSDKVDDDDNIDHVVEEEAMKLRNFIVDLLTPESLHVDVVDKTTLDIQETVSTREFSAENLEIEQASSGEGVVGVVGSESDEETEEMIFLGVQNLENSS